MLAMRARHTEPGSDVADRHAVVARFWLRDRECLVLQAVDGSVQAAIGALMMQGCRYCVVLTDEPAVKGRRDPLDTLTPRELEIALHVARGSEAKAIARNLRISFHTVRVHVGRIYAKLGLRKQTELAACIASRLGPAIDRAD
jgi:DNA-binding NarL/FixJ family response regulator